MLRLGALGAALGAAGLGDAFITTSGVALCARETSSSAAFGARGGSDAFRRARRRQRACMSSKDPWMEALEEASGMNTGGILGTVAGGGKKLMGLGKPREDDVRVQQNQRLIQWLGDNGVWVFDRSDWGQAPHPLAVAIDTVDESENESAGRGMVANRPIKEGDELFAMPVEVLLTKAKAQEVLGRDAITDDLGEYQAIALLLISERAKGEESDWKSYIDVLPSAEEVFATYVWKEEDLALLEGSPVIAATESMRRKLRAEYKMLEDGLFKRLSEKFPAEVYSYDAFVWAFSILFSRAIRLTSLATGEAVALVPYADLFNHNPFANSFIDAREVGFLTKRNEVVVYADRSYKAMEQVYISYGPKSNADLLLLYGFCLDRNPFNSVDLTLNLDPSDPLRRDKEEFLEAVGQEKTATIPIYSDRYPDELLQFLRLVCLDKEDRNGRDLDDIAFEDPVSDANEFRVLTCIEEACQKALKNYPTTEEEDTALMVDGRMFASLGKAQRMAVKHRRQEKRILKKTIAAVSAARQKLPMPLSI